MTVNATVSLPLPEPVELPSRFGRLTRMRATYVEVRLYRAIIVENVVDAAEWVLFPAWRAALVALGHGRLHLLR